MITPIAALASQQSLHSNRTTTVALSPDRIKTYPDIYTASTAPTEILDSP